MNVRYFTGWFSAQYSITLPIFSWVLLGTLVAGVVVYVVWRYWW